MAAKKALPTPVSTPVAGSQIQPARAPGSGVSAPARKLLRPRRSDLAAALADVRAKFAKERGLKLTYTPTNLEVYVNAFDGCLAGMLFGRPNVSKPLRTAEASQVLSAGIWAQEFDGQWDDATALTEVEAELILLGSQGLWAQRTTTYLTAEAAMFLITPLLSTITVVDLYLSSVGVTPGNWGGGS